MEDYRDRRGQQQQDDREPYEVERIAAILAVTCMFLSALYTIFAILLFLYYGSEDRELLLLETADDHDGVVVGVVGGVVSSSKPLSSIPRRENFITMGE